MTVAEVLVVVVVVVILAMVVVVVVLVVVVVAVVSSSSAVFFVDIVVVLLFCRNSTFELVVDCMRAGLEKKEGSRGGAAPPAGEGWGGRTPPHLQTYSLLAKQKL